MPNGVDPIADGEELYRRVPACWYDASTSTLSDHAFAPHKDRDTTGLSLFRANHKTTDDLGRPGTTYYVAVVTAGDIRAAGIRVESRPNVGGQIDVAHVELPELNAETRKDKATLEAQRLLVSKSRILGPFTKPPLP